MNSYSLVHLSDATLVRDLTTAVHRERGLTAEVLAYLAEFDERRLYLPAGYPSMYAYCVGELRFSEDEACKRIRAARAARQFPTLFESVAEGRLHLSAIVMLAPHFTPENVEELIAAATHQSKAGVEQLIADRFPRTELLQLVQPVEAARGVSSAPERMESDAEPSAPGRIPTLCTQPKATPIAPERYALQVTIGKEAHEALQYAKALLGHSIPSGDLAEVLERLIALGVRQLERRKFAATSRPRQPRPHAYASARHIPAEVKRVVWQRDGGQCTFVATNGHRCPARTRLEFDHADPVAHGGTSTLENVRLRCRAHNQHAAERAFGPDFLRRKREEAKIARTQHAIANHGAGAGNQAREIDRDAAELVPWLRSLGFRTEDSRRAALAACQELPDGAIEEKLRLAISYFGRRPTCVNGSRSRAAS